MQIGCASGSPSGASGGVGGGEMRPAGIEPAACGLKDRCSLAPRREPLTTELRARAVSLLATLSAAGRNLSRLGAGPLQRGRPRSGARSLTPHGRAALPWIRRAPLSACVRGSQRGMRTQRQMRHGTPRTPGGPRRARWRRSLAAAARACSPRLGGRPRRRHAALPHQARLRRPPPPGRAACLADAAARAQAAGRRQAAGSVRGPPDARRGQPNAKPYPGFLTPADACTTPTTLPDETAAGSTQTIAVVDAFDDPTAEADLAVYEQTVRPARLHDRKRLLQEGQPERPSAPAAESRQAAGRSEISIDVQMAHAICQSCQRRCWSRPKREEFSDLGAASNAAVETRRDRDQQLLRRHRGTGARELEASSPTTTRGSSSPPAPATAATSTGLPPTNSPKARTSRPTRRHVLVRRRHVADRKRRHLDQHRLGRRRQRLQRSLQRAAVAERDRRLLGDWLRRQAARSPTWPRSATRTPAWTSMTRPPKNRAADRLGRVGRHLGRLADRRRASSRSAGGRQRRRPTRRRRSTRTPAKRRASTT